MNHEPDVLVIGGGAVGVCSAYYLVERGFSVALVEKDEICSGCSWGNAGLIVPSHSIPLAAPGVVAQGLKWMLNPESPFYIKPRLSFELISWLWKFSRAATKRRALQSTPVLAELSRASMDLFDELAALEGLEFAFAHRGALILYLTQKGLEGGIKEAEMLGRVGIESQVMNQQQVRQLEPTLSSSPGIGGVYYPGDAQLIPAEFVEGLAARVEKSGGKILPSTEIFGFESDGKRITSVRTTRGELHPREVVLCAGCWSPAILKNLGIKVPIQPAKGYSITIKKPPGSPDLPVIFGEAKATATPMGDTLRFAGTLELAGLDFSINQRRVGAILRAARNYLPAIEEFDLIRTWRGLRPCTPDGLPILARAKTLENLIVAAGHATLGVSLGPVTGKLVSQIVAGDEPLIPLEPLALERF